MMAHIVQMAVMVRDNREWLEVNDAFYNQFLSMAATGERSRAQRFLHRIDSWRLLVGRSLARYCLSKVAELGHNREDLIFGERAQGKPYLEHPNSKDVEFNISHAGDWVIVGAMESTGELGVDVAKVEVFPGGDLEQLFLQFRSYFSEHEWQQINLNPDKQIRLHFFYRFWVLKESYLKATGEGITGIQLPAVQFTLLDPAPGGKDDAGYFDGARTQICVSVNSVPVTKYKFWLSYLDTEHVCALCCSTDHKYSKPEIISLTQLLDD